jgi:hypothetical protein
MDVRDELKPLIGIFSPQELATATEPPESACDMCPQKKGHRFSLRECICSPRTKLCGQCFDNLFDNSSNNAEEFLFVSLCCHQKIKNYDIQ